MLRFLPLFPSACGAALLLMACTSTLPAQEPAAKLAREARYDLTGADELAEGAVLSGTGSISRPGWLKDDAQKKAYVVAFPTTQFWSEEVAVRFIPRTTGEVELKLSGLWEEVVPGKRSRLEVEWTSLKVEGAEFVDSPSLHGKPIRSWHDEPVHLRLKVAANTPVILRTTAVPVVPPGLPTMRRITRRDTPAHRAAAGFRRGANAGNYLEVPPDQNWSVPHSPADIAQMKKEGFDHVRIPVAWHHYTGPGPDYTISADIFQKVDVLLKSARAQKLRVLLNIHHFEPLNENPEAEKARFFAMWRQIAEHYADAPPEVAFELLNEPYRKATTEVMNALYAEVIPLIRQSNPSRTLFVGPGQWNKATELPALLLPDADENLIVTLHSYEPFSFTHQGANWTGQDHTLTGIVFPGPPAKPLAIAESASQELRDWVRQYNTLPPEQNPSSAQAFQSAVQIAKHWSEYYGRPIHWGEFGAYTKADDASRARYYRAFRRAAESAGQGWAIWDWRAGFRYWDPEKKAPKPGLREALFQK